MNDAIKLAKPIRQLTSLVRPKYSPGLLLQDDDLTTAVSYTRNLSRLMFRSLFGCGVLCGLKVGVPGPDPCGGIKAEIAKGVALSCAGDPIEVPTDQVVLIDSCANSAPNTLWFAVKHIETCCVPRTAQCPPDEDEPPSTCTRDRDGFEIRVFECRPPCSCGCTKLAPVHVSFSDTAAGTASNKGTAKEVKSRRKVSSASSANPSGTASPCPPEPPPETVPVEPADPCLCNLRTGTYTPAGSNAPLPACYHDHYQGECPCDCCDCDWIILAYAERANEQSPWMIDHSVRRFVRPVLMRDPIVQEERKL